MAALVKLYRCDVAAQESNQQSQVFTRDWKTETASGPGGSGPVENRRSFGSSFQIVGAASSGIDSKERLQNSQRARRLTRV